MSVVFLDSGRDLLFIRFERSTVPKIKDPQKNRPFNLFYYRTFGELQNMKSTSPHRGRRGQSLNLFCRTLAIIVKMSEYATRLSNAPETNLFPADADAALG
jgi:hypothetical protein